MKINLQMMDLQTLTLTEPLRLSLLDLLLLTSQFHLLFEIEITSPCSQEVNSSSSRVISSRWFNERVTSYNTPTRIPLERPCIKKGLTLNSDFPLAAGKLHQKQMLLRQGLRPKSTFQRQKNKKHETLEAPSCQKIEDLSSNIIFSPNKATRDKRLLSHLLLFESERKTLIRRSTKAKDKAAFQSTFTHFLSNFSDNIDEIHLFARQSPFCDPKPV